MATTSAAGVNDTNQVTTTGLPAWYTSATQNMGTQAVNIANANNSNPLPAQNVAGFNADQAGAFDAVRSNFGTWGPAQQAAYGATAEMAPTVAKFVDYAQGTVGGPAYTTGASVQPWAQGAQDAMSGSAQGWTDPGTVQKYMSPYTSQVVDNIGRLGKRNWEDSIMPGVNSSMIGSGQFGSTRNADILGRAGVNAANDITGQQSTALQAGYNSAAGIFNTDANRYQQQQQLQSTAAMSGGKMMQDSMAADANRMQQQQQMQATTAMNGATAATNLLNTVSDNYGALAQSYQALNNTDIQSLLNVGNQEQNLQQSGLTAAYNNAQAARQDPWNQLQNMMTTYGAMRVPTTSETSSSSSSGVAPSNLSAAAIAMLTAAGMMPK